MCKVAVLFLFFSKSYLLQTSISCSSHQPQGFSIIFILCVKFSFNSFMFMLTFRWFIDMAEITDFFAEFGKEFQPHDVRHIKYLLQDSLTGKLYNRFSSNFSRECSFLLQWLVISLLITILLKVAQKWDVLHVIFVISHFHRFFSIDENICEAVQL